MPEAAVDQDHDAVLRQHHVSPAGQIATMKAEAIAEMVQRASNG